MLTATHSKEQKNLRYFNCSYSYDSNFFLSGSDVHIFWEDNFRTLK